LANVRNKLFSSFSRTWVSEWMSYYYNLYRELHYFKKGLENNTVGPVEVAEKTKYYEPENTIGEVK
jgi:hypothetical protein